MSKPTFAQNDKAIALPINSPLPFFIGQPTIILVLQLRYHWSSESIDGDGSGHDKWRYVG